MLRLLRMRGATRCGIAVAAAAAIGIGQASCEAALPPTGLAAAHPSTIVTARAEKPSLTLEYFCLRGLGELPRLVLEATGTPYNSVFHFASGGVNWKDYSPFGQLPILRDGTLLMTESGAMYAARPQPPHPSPLPRLLSASSPCSLLSSLSALSPRPSSLVPDL